MKSNIVTTVVFLIASLATIAKKTAFAAKSRIGKSKSASSSKASTSASKKSSSLSSSKKKKFAVSCTKVTLLGTQAGPGVFNGLAGAGTIVTYGSIESNCSDGVKLMFDIGRGTVTNLSKMGIQPTDIDGIFITHTHSDHVDDLAIFLMFRWFFRGTTIPIICSNDVTSTCENLITNIDAAYVASGEIQRRKNERPNLNPGGPRAIGVFNPLNVQDDNEYDVWVDPNNSNIKVTGIRTNHVTGHASFKVYTPAGTVVIGGDASNDEPDPQNRLYSTSDNVEYLSEGADILVHSCIHPVYAPGSGFNPIVYNRQSNVYDLAEMAERTNVKNLVLTHLAPPPGATAPFFFPPPGGPLTKQDYEDAALDADYTGNIYVGEDMLDVTIYEYSFV